MAFLEKSIGEHVNYSPEPVISGPILIGSTTSVTLITEKQTTDLIDTKITVTNYGNKDLWVKLQPASLDNDKKGIMVPAGETQIVFEAPNMTPVEVSGIMNSGGAKAVYVTTL